MNEIIQHLITVLPTDSVSMSQQIDKFCAAFLKVQSQIDPIKKSMQAHRHKYANIDVVLEEVLPILEQNKIFVNQPPVTNGAEKLQTILFHESGQFISYGAIKIIHDPQDIQSFGGGVTYTRRYALVSILGLPQEDDDGNYQKKQYEQKKELISQDQIDDLKGRILESNKSREEKQEMLKSIYTDTKVNSLEQLTQKQYYFIKSKYFK
jgi:ERF superfamily protein